MRAPSALGGEGSCGARVPGGAAARLSTTAVRSLRHWTRFELFADSAALLPGLHELLAMSRPHRWVEFPHARWPCAWLFSSRQVTALYRYTGSRARLQLAFAENPTISYGDYSQIVVPGISGTPSSSSSSLSSSTSMGAGAPSLEASLSSSTSMGAGAAVLVSKPSPLAFGRARPSRGRSTERLGKSGPLFLRGCSRLLL